MLLPNLETARAIEAADSFIQRNFAENHRRLIPQSQADWLTQGSVHATFITLESPLTQVFGMGLGLTEDPAEADKAFGLTPVENFFFDHRAAVNLEVCQFADPRFFALLGERGYSVSETSLVLGQPVKAPIEKAADDRIAALVPQEREAFIRALSCGFAEQEEPPELLTEIFSVYAEEPGRLCWRAEQEGRIVGGCSLFTHGPIAFFGGTAILPPARGRGLQKALIRVRSEAAHAAGCNLGVVVVEPGTVSHHNALKMGFATLYGRFKFSKPYR